MTEQEKAAIRAEFAAANAEIDRRLIEVLSQDRVRGGVLGKVRRRAREVRQGETFREVVD